MISPTSSVGRVMVAPADDPLEWTPTWVCLDFFPNLVSGVDIQRGRQTEFDTTDTSTAIVYINDKDGLFDPENTGSPFIGLTGLDGKQITLQAWNPVTAAWVPQTRMWIDEITYDFNPATADGKSILSNVQLHCVDIFDFLAGIQMDLTEVTGDRVFGFPPPTGYEANVFYEDTDEDDGTGFQDRVTAILDDCGLTTDWYVVFTGNIDCLEGVYDPGDSPLIAIRDALDAEFPGIANGYSDKLGRFVAHGRKARFDPDTVSDGADWTFARWKAGDGAAIVADGDRAQIRPPLSWSRDRKKVYNVGYAYPNDIALTDKPGQFVVDAFDSIADFGRRTWSAEGLLVKRGTTTGNTGNDEAKLYAAFFVANYSTPRTRVEGLTLQSLRPDDPRATATWAMALSADISDVVNLEHGYAGADGVGISEDFYIEGSSMQIRPLDPDFDLVTVTFNVSPTDYYNDPAGLLG